MRFLWKWLVCRWLHEKDRCFPQVWTPEPGEPINPWHCMRCHPCSEDLDRLMGVGWRISDR